MSIKDLVTPTLSAKTILWIVSLVVAGFGIYYFGFRNDQNPPAQTSKPSDSIAKGDTMQSGGVSKGNTTLPAKNQPNATSNTGGIEMQGNSRNDGINNTGNDNTIIQNNSKVGGNQTNINDADLRGAEIVFGDKNVVKKDSTK